MARIRSIKPEFWTHEELSALPEATHMLAGALLNYADDHGYFNANTGLIKAACSPLREPSVSIPESLRSLQGMGYIRLGTATDGKRYGQVVHFDQHQRVSHPTQSKIAELTITWENSGISPESLRNPPETFCPEQGTGNREQGSGKGTGNRDSSSLRSDSSSTVVADPATSNEVGKPEAGKPVLTLTPPCAKPIDKAERLRQVTLDAIEAFNAVLGKPKGLLPAVSLKVGIQKRELNVRRCLRVAREICAELYHSTTITRGFWEAYFGQCAEDDFKSGRQTGGPGHENWTPSFEYLTREKTMLEVFDKASSQDAA